MANPLMDNPNRAASNPASRYNALKSMGSPQFVYDQMYRNNPRFRQFADQVRNMTPEQAFRQHGLNFEQFKSFKW